MISELTRRNLEGGVVSHFEVLSWLFPEEYEENHKNVFQDSHMHAILITAEDLMHFLRRYVAPLSWSVLDGQPCLHRNSKHGE